MGIDDGSRSKHLTTAAWKPQATAIIKRIHQVLGNYMQTFDLDNADLDKENPWNE